MLVPNRRTFVRDTPRKIELLILPLPVQSQIVKALLLNIPCSFPLIVCPFKQITVELSNVTLEFKVKSPVST